jgi:hypothetical protein
MNFSFLVIVYNIIKTLLEMSGNEVIIYLSGVIELSFLYSISPKALDRFKFPLTRPSTTYPPAAAILLLSFGSSGL